MILIFSLVSYNLFKQLSFIVVEVFSSMLNIGLGFGFLPGMFYDRFGPQWTSVLGLLVSVPAYVLIWSSSRNVKFYAQNSWLMAIFFFLCGNYRLYVASGEK